MTALPAQAGQSLPELPEPSAWVSLNVLTQKASVGNLPITALQPGVYQNEKVFSEDQMRTYALAAIAAKEAEVVRLMGDLRTSEADRLELLAKLKKAPDWHDLLTQLVEALDNTFISSWQSTAGWKKQLDQAMDALKANQGETK